MLQLRPNCERCDGDRVVVPQNAASRDLEDRFFVVVNWFTELRQRTGN